MFKKKNKQSQQAQQPVEQKPQPKPQPKTKFCDDLKPGQQITVCARRMTVIAIEGDSVILSNSGTPTEWKKAWLEACPDKRK